jgi:NAD(P)-dependent dehydrogenase (short-subunit alcohol dehydrogenase family)
MGATKTNCAAWRRRLEAKAARQPAGTLDLLTCTPDSCQELAQRISNTLSRLDGVLHNAGLLGMFAHG